MTVEAFLDEAKIMHKLRHRKLVQLMGVCTEKEPVYIITEFMENGALLEFLRNDGRSLTIVNLIDMAAQVSSTTLPHALNVNIVFSFSYDF